jgi:hypothetical protein
MTPKEKATEIYNKMKGFRVTNSHLKKCALNCVDMVISANPHSNPMFFQQWIFGRT